MFNRSVLYPLPRRRSSESGQAVIQDAMSYGSGAIEGVEQDRGYAGYEEDECDWTAR